MPTFAHIKQNHNHPLSFLMTRISNINTNSAAMMTVMSMAMMMRSRRNRV